MTPSHDFRTNVEPVALPRPVSTEAMTCAQSVIGSNDLGHVALVIDQYLRAALARVTA